MSRSGVDDVLECMICLDDVQNGHLCPLCAKGACFKCWNDTLHKERVCPCCRGDLTDRSLFKCYWLTDLGESVGKFRKDAESNRVEKELLKEKKKALVMACQICEEERKKIRVEKERLNKMQQDHLDAQQKWDEERKKLVELNKAVKETLKEMEQEHLYAHQKWDEERQMLDEMNRKEKETIMKIEQQYLHARRKWGEERQMLDEKISLKTKTIEEMEKEILKTRQEWDEERKKLVQMNRAKVMEMKEELLKAIQQWDEELNILDESNEPTTLNAESVGREASIIDSLKSIVRMTSELKLNPKDKFEESIILFKTMESTLQELKTNLLKLKQKLEEAGAAA